MKTTAEIQLFDLLKEVFKEDRFQQIVSEIKHLANDNSLGQEMIPSQI